MYRVRNNIRQFFLIIDMYIVYINVQTKFKILYPYMNANGCLLNVLYKFPTGSDGFVKYLVT